MASKFAKDESPIYNNEQIRIVLVGKTGVGKSATGNTILGEKKFESKFSSKSQTKLSFKASNKVDGQEVAVIDTPGLFDTTFDEKETSVEIGRCIRSASPGPHIFLVVIRLGRFTDEEKSTVQKIRQIFGEESDKYSMVLFTGGDLLEDEKTIEEFLEESEELQQLVSKCNGQYHVFNNKLKDRFQVRELLKKIRNVTEKNGGSHYTNEMFQEAERKIKEEQERIQREKEEELRKQQEVLKDELTKQFNEELSQIKDELKKREAEAAFARELEKQMHQLKLDQEIQARKFAEENAKVQIQLIEAQAEIKIAKARADAADARADAEKARAQAEKARAQAADARADAEKSRAHAANARADDTAKARACAAEASARAAQAEARAAAAEASARAEAARAEAARAHAAGAANARSKPGCTIS